MTTGRTSWILGSRAERADIVIAIPLVSGAHCKLSADDEGCWYIEDLGSTNGTSLDGVMLAPGEARPLTWGSEIRFGKRLVWMWDRDLASRLQENPAAFATHLRSLLERGEGSGLRELPGRAQRATLTQQEVSSGSAEAAHAGRNKRDTTSVETSTLPETAARAMEAPLGAAFLRVGFDPRNDIVVQSHVVSRFHARVWSDGSTTWIEDVGSKNGVLVEGKRVGWATLEVGAVVLLGTHPWRIDEDARERLRDRRAQGAATKHPAAQGTVLVVGRDPNADIVLDLPIVSARHLRLEARGDGLWRAEDLGSTNGTALNDRDNALRTFVVAEDDELFLGSYRISVEGLLARHRGGLKQASGAYTGLEGVWVIGRDAERCNVALDDPQVSREHARVRRLRAGRFEVEDLQSANGTFVDGGRIQGKVQVDAGARLVVGHHSLRLDDEQGVVVRDFRGDITLQAERICVDVPDRAAAGGTRRIVHEVSFTAYPSEFVGLMGPSGAGKTTLLTALNGYQPPSAGRSLLNGVDLVERYDLFRNRIGYVPQDDIVYAQLTVYQSLYFTARLRLPEDTTKDEIDARIAKILETLEIQQTRDTRIGDATRRGISGGQRKRVNLAQELLTEPSLLLLDEPTSGLASEDTINVMRLLRRLADDGKTVILTIHQPSLEAYRLMDNVLLLFQGRLVYYGPSWPDSILFFHPEPPTGQERERLLADPGNALRPLAQDQRKALEAGDAPSREKALAEGVQVRRQAYVNSDHYRQYVYDRATSTRPSAEASASARQRPPKAGFWRQLGILSQRNALIKRTDLAYVAVLLVQAPIIALVLAMVFAGVGGGLFEAVSRGPAALFLLVASAIWFGCSNSAREIVAEAPMYRRERMVNLRIPAYVGSKFLVLGGLCAIQCLLLLGIAFVPLGLEGSFLALYGVLFLASMAGLGMGLTLSALASSSEAAMGLVPLLLIPQIILGGVIMPVHEMKLPMKVLSMTMVSRWGYEAMLHVEHGPTDAARLRDACGIPACMWGVGPTGLSYYPSDPALVQEAVERSGMRALEGRVVIPVEPRADHEICRAYCTSLQRSWPITPLERSFGVHRQDVERQRAERDIVHEGRSPDAFVLPRPSAHTSRWGSIGVLLGFLPFLFGLVCAAMKARDVAIGD